MRRSKEYWDAYWAATEGKWGDISATTVRVLYDAGLTEPAEVCAKTDAELLSIPGVGKTHLRHIREYFAKRNSIHEMI